MSKYFIHIDSEDFKSIEINTAKLGYIIYVK